MKRAANADRDEFGSQLRPHIVWFGEAVQNFEQSAGLVEAVDKVLVVGTSLSVYPATSLADLCQPSAEKVLVALEVDHLPQGFEFLKGRATEMVLQIVRTWTMDK